MLLGMQQEWQYSEMNILCSLVTKFYSSMRLENGSGPASTRGIRRLNIQLLSSWLFRGFLFPVYLFFLFLILAIFADPSELYKCTF